jgi:hypothetical protein
MEGSMTGSDQNREEALRVFARTDQMHTDLMAASLDSARDAMKALFLLNGGASIALLGFLASTFSEDFTVDESLIYRSMMISLAYFGYGAFAAVITSSLAYLVNSLYAGATAHMDRSWEWPYVKHNAASHRCWRSAIALNWVCVASGAASLLCFGIGMHSLSSFL